MRSWGIVKILLFLTILLFWKPGLKRPAKETPIVGAEFLPVKSLLKERNRAGVVIKPSHYSAQKLTIVCSAFMTKSQSVLVAAKDVRAASALCLAAVLGVCALASYAATEAGRLFYTADLPLKPGERKSQTQVFSMNPDGSDVRQHTSSPGTKAHASRCASRPEVFFQNEDALNFLNERQEEEVFLSAKGVQYHSPRCSSEGKYLSLTAWDKVKKRGFIEVYALATRQRVSRWPGEYASWMRGRPIVIYRYYDNPGGPGKISLYTRDLDRPQAAARLLHSEEVGESVYDVSEPQIVGPAATDFVFRVYDEHEYFYYLRHLGDSFVLTRNRQPLEHHNVYAGSGGPSLEQGNLALSPDGKFAVMEEHPWNTPPSLYLIDLKTRDSRKIAEGFNPTWSADSSRVFFNKDPGFYDRYAKAPKHGENWTQIYPRSLEGYEIYVYDLGTGKEARLTHNTRYDGFL